MFLIKRVDRVKRSIMKGYYCSRYNIDHSVSIKSSTKIFGEGMIEIKKGTYFGANTYVVSNPAKAKISIGENCMISHDVHIRTSQYEIGTIHLPKKKKRTIHDNITIGDNVWIGKGVYIKGGIIIGDNVTIGANSVVTKNIQKDKVVGGIPARIISERTIVN